tara:strand:- start:99 stop:692 length:594 start_codon:yes stop_codon:yes gene_type:complete
MINLKSLNYIFMIKIISFILLFALSSSKILSENLTNEQIKKFDLLSDKKKSSLKKLNKETIKVLFTAISDLSKYNVPSEFPELVFVSHKKINKPNCEPNCRVLGRYVGGKEIHLNEKLDPEKNLFDRSILLHEMVHYLQELENPGEINKLANKIDKCEVWFKREREAYDIQESYLEYMGSPMSAGFFPKVSICNKFK